MPHPNPKGRHAPTAGRPHMHPHTTLLSSTNHPGLHCSAQSAYAPPLGLPNKVIGKRQYKYRVVLGTVAQLRCARSLPWLNTETVHAWLRSWDVRAPLLQSRSRLGYNASFPCVASEQALRMTRADSAWAGLTVIDNRRAAQPE